MERKKFMREARLIVHKILQEKEIDIMNLMQQAWFESKRNVGVKTLQAALDEAVDRLEQKSDSEVVYPTWGEWLIQQGVLKAGTTTMYGITWQPVGDNLFESIPADFAKKLGVKPKEG